MLLKGLCSLEEERSLLQSPGEKIWGKVSEITYFTKVSEVQGQYVENDRQFSWELRSEVIWKLHEFR